MSEGDLADVSGQAGLTINGDLVMKGSDGPNSDRFDVSLKNPGDDNFLVLDNALIDMGISNLTLDAEGAYTSSFAGDGVSPAVVVGLPDRLDFRDSSLGTVIVSWTEDGSLLGQNKQADAIYRLFAGANNLYGDGDDADFTLTHNQGANVNLDRVSGVNAAYNNDGTTGTWTWAPGVYTEGQFDIADVRVQGEQTVNFFLDSDDGAGGGGFLGLGRSDRPDPFMRVIDTNTLENPPFGPGGGLPDGDNPGGDDDTSFDCGFLCTDNSFRNQERMLVELGY
ncbi:MAG: hypothetical protein ACQES2_11305, partial [Pseudomonadota bacterium]